MSVASSGVSPLPVSNHGRSRLLADLDARVRFADVAQFVELSLLRDPALGRPLRRRPFSLPPASVTAAEQGWAEASASRGFAAPSKSTKSASTTLSVRSDSVVNRTDQLRTQLQLLRAEKRAEMEQLQKLELTLSESLKKEQQAAKRATKQRELRDFHRKRTDEVNTRIDRLNDAIRAGERVAQAREEMDKKSRSTWGGSLATTASPHHKEQSAPSLGSSTWSPQHSGVDFPSAPRLSSSGDALGSVSPGAASTGSQGARVALAAVGAAGDEEEEDEDSSPPRLTDPPSAIEIVRDVSTPGFGERGEHGASRSSSAGQQEDLPEKQGSSLEVGGVVVPEEGVSLQEWFEAAEGGRKVKPMAMTMPSGLGAHEAPGDTEHGMIQSSMSMPVLPAMSSLGILEEPGDSAGAARSGGIETPKLPDDPVERKREVVRIELKRNAGTTKRAFKAINLNGSGKICSQEFADGVSRLGVQWKQLTGLRRPRELFKLFDLDKDGVIDLVELFPEEKHDRNEEPPSTPDFWRRWCRHKYNPEVGSPAWHSQSAEEELQQMIDHQEQSHEATLRRKWMSSTMRRLKTRGKSDARCREIVALHLPKGTGPKDRDDVGTFSEFELRDCRRLYKDEVLEPVRNIQKVVYDLREQRRILSSSRQKLWNVAMEPLMRQKQDEDRRNAAAMMGKLHIHGMPHLHKQVEQPSASFSELAQQTGMEVGKIEAIFRVWMQHADKTEIIQKRNFGKLLEELCPKRTLPESDIEAWWGQVLLRANNAAEAQPDAVVPSISEDPLFVDEMAMMSPTRSVEPNFDQFIAWFAESEARDF